MMTKYILYIMFISNVTGDVTVRHYSSANLRECEYRAASISLGHQVIEWSCDKGAET